MINIRDSSLSITIGENIIDSKNNDATISRETSKYNFGEIIFDNPSIIPRQFWDLFESTKTQQEVPPEMKYNPESFARKFYNTADLWWFVLLSNNMTTHREFKNDWAYACDSKTVDILKDLLEATSVAINKTIKLEDLTLYPIKV